MLRRRHRNAPADAYAELRRGSITRYAPDLLVDAGASRGNYARRTRREGFEGRILSLEPLSQPFERLKRRSRRHPLWECRRAAVGSRPGRATMFVSGNSVSSSLLEMTTVHSSAAPASATVGQETVEVVRIDELGIRPDERIFLKCDLQGYELEALRGAAGVLDQVVLAELELSMRELYSGQPLIDEVLAFLMGHGLCCIGLQQGFSQPDGSWLQADGLFVRPAAVLA
jgi:FkbM family methyltransferase